MRDQNIKLLGWRPTSDSFEYVGLNEKYLTRMIEPVKTINQKPRVSEEKRDLGSGSSCVDYTRCHKSRPVVLQVV